MFLHMIKNFFCRKLIHSHNTKNQWQSIKTKSNHILGNFLQIHQKKNFIDINFRHMRRKFAFTLMLADVTIDNFDGKGNWAIFAVLVSLEIFPIIIYDKNWSRKSAKNLHPKILFCFGHCNSVNTQKKSYFYEMKFSHSILRLILWKSSMTSSSDWHFIKIMKIGWKNFKCTRNCLKKYSSIN